VLVKSNKSNAALPAGAHAPLSTQPHANGHACNVDADWHDMMEKA